MQYAALLILQNVTKIAAISRHSWRACSITNFTIIMYDNKLLVHALMQPQLKCHTYFFSSLALSFIPKEMPAENFNEFVIAYLQWWIISSKNYLKIYKVCCDI